MKRLSEARDFFFQHVLDKDLAKVPFYHRFLLRVMRVFYAVLSDISKGELSLRAMSLVYTTLITLVPLLAISFSVMKGLGVHNQIKPFLLTLLEPFGNEGEYIAARLIGFVDNIEVGVLGAVGLAFLVYSVIALMQKIETAFNFIWRVERPRSLAQRFSDYLSVLLVWPLFLFISAGMTASVRNFDLLHQMGLGGVVNVFASFLAIIIPYVIMALAFTFIFAFMPNTRVRILPAFIGGLFAAFMWKTMSFIFSALIVGSANYVAIYAAFASLIIFMIWMYLSWFVMLIGASISFYVQHPRYILIGYSAFHLSIRMREKIGLMIVYLIGRDFYCNKNKWDAVSLSHQINMPVTAILDVLKTLEETGVIAKTAENESTYIPALPLDEASVEDVLRRIRSHGEKALLSYDRLGSKEAINDVLDKGAEHHIRSLTKVKNLWEKPQALKMIKKKENIRRALNKFLA